MLQIHAHARTRALTRALTHALSDSVYRVRKCQFPSHLRTRAHAHQNLARPRRALKVQFRSHLRTCARIFGVAAPRGKHPRVDFGTLWRAAALRINSRKLRTGDQLSEKAGTARRRHARPFQA